ncbi:hypothetical protein MTP03_06910 [Tsukamurella sp. PLM1]|nr:hypothetical protein MTP03_06910 [Tsukamurella sp. PLM1]
MSRYAEFTELKIDTPEEGILRITLDAPNLNAVGPQAHRELADVWPVIGLDESVRAVLIRGAGSGPSPRAAASTSSRT